MFGNNEALFQHKTNKHAISENTVLKADGNINSSQYEFFPCPICGQAVENGPEGLDRHLELLKPLMGIKIECRHCKVGFIEQRALLQHSNFCKLKY
jgi:hypothetical protein